MIDDLAKAICCPSGCKGGPKCNMDSYGVLYRACARAVLERLQEPTPEMEHAGRNVRLQPGEEFTVRSIFRAMIETAKAS